MLDAHLRQNRSPMPRFPRNRQTRFCSLREDDFAKTKSSPLIEWFKFTPEEVDFLIKMNRYLSNMVLVLNKKGFKLPRVEKEKFILLMHLGLRL